MKIVLYATSVHPETKAFMSGLKCQLCSFFLSGWLGLYVLPTSSGTVLMPFPAVCVVSVFSCWFQFSAHS